MWLELLEFLSPICPQRRTQGSWEISIPLEAEVNRVSSAPFFFFLLHIEGRGQLDILDGIIPYTNVSVSNTLAL